MADPITEIKFSRPGVVVESSGPVVTATRPPSRSSTATVEVLAPNLLRTSRMVLRPMRAADRSEYLRVLARSREHLAPWMSLHREGESDSELFERQLLMGRLGDERGAAWRRVGMLEDGRLAGFFNLNSISRGLTFEADANWWVPADLAGVGLGTEGVLAMMDFALQESPKGLSLHRVQAAIAPGNIPSIKLASRVGMRKVEAAQVNVRIGGSWENHDLWARSVLG